MEISGASPSRTSASNLLALGTRYEFDIDFINLYGNLNSTPIYTFAGSPSSTSTFRDLYLLADNDVDGVSYKARGKLEYFVAYDRNAKLIHNLLPAKRNSDNVIGMYDEVNNVFYTNAGSGQFIPGPEVSDYTFLEYIESTGTQYINTGFTPSGTTRFDVGFNTSSLVGATGFGTIFGSRQNHYTRGYQLTTYSDDITVLKGHFLYGTSANTPEGLATIRHNVDIVVGSNMHIIYSENTLTSNDVVTDTISAQSFTAPSPIYVFALNENGSATEFSNTKLQFLSIYDNGVLVREYIPAIRKSDGVVGLYDKANDVFYTNAGTGEFIGGQPV